MRIITSELPFITNRERRRKSYAALQDGDVDNSCLQHGSINQTTVSRSLHCKPWNCDGIGKLASRRVRSKPTHCWPCEPRRIYACIQSPAGFAHACVHLIHGICIRMLLSITPVVEQWSTPMYARHLRHRGIRKVHLLLLLDLFANSQASLHRLLQPVI